MQLCNQNADDKLKFLIRNANVPILNLFNTIIPSKNC